MNLLNEGNILFKGSIYKGKLRLGELEVSTDYEELLDFLKNTDRPSMGFFVIVKGQTQIVRIKKTISTKEFVSIFNLENEDLMKVLRYDARPDRYPSLTKRLHKDLGLI